MDIQTTKLKLLKTILDNEDAEFIQRLADFVQKEESDFWDELSPPEQEEIIQGINELDRGHRISYDDFINKI